MPTKNEFIVIIDYSTDKVYIRRIPESLKNDDLIVITNYFGTKLSIDLVNCACICTEKSKISTSKLTARSGSVDLFIIA